MSEDVRVVRGGLHRDARGTIQYVNSFCPARADRFYVIHPADTGVRGWTGHRRETKWFFPIVGRFQIGVVEPREWSHPTPNEMVERIELVADEPAVLEIAPGNYTAIRAVTPGATLLVFSTGTIESAKEDDFRRPAEFWRF